MGGGLYHSGLDSSRSIFIHVPKTGGTSIGEALYGYAAGHHTCAEFRDSNPNKFHLYFKFSFVRNPWDRLVSAYFHLKSESGVPINVAWFRDNLSKYRDFEHFVHEGLSSPNVSSWVHFRPQVDFITDSVGKVLVDFVGHFEDIQIDFSHVAQRVGIRNSLPWANKSCHEHYISYYSDDTREIVRQFYQKDVEVLGYDFSGRIANSKILMP